MQTLDRYIGLSVLRGFVTVLMVLLSLFSFIELVTQLDDVGKGNYKALDAILYVIATLPGRAVEIAPITALIGGIVGLGALARGSELIAMQAAGISNPRIAGSVMKTGVLLMLVIALSMEVIVPRIETEAEARRLLAVSQTGDILRGQGYWARDGNRFLNVGVLRDGLVPTDIHIYSFDEGANLIEYLHAEYASFEENGDWRLVTVVEKRRDADGLLRTRHLAERGWQPFATLAELRILETQAHRMAPTQIAQLVEQLRGRGENADRFELLFWRKVMIPVSTVAMLYLALPFVFGSLRSAGFGLRLVLGIGVGLTFYIANQILSNLGLLWGTGAALIAVAPSLMIATLAAIMLRRSR
jgi:lipopolysaccharide export system permease protein